MAVSANRKAQAGFVYTRESTAPYTGIPNLLQKVNIMQNNIPAQTAQKTVTIPHKLANDAADACFYADRASENLAAILEAVEALIDISTTTQAGQAQRHNLPLIARNLIKTAKNEVETLAELHPFSLFETATDLNNEIYSQTHGAK